VERVQADGGLRHPVAGNGQVDAGAVQADRLDLGGAGVAHGVEEFLEGLFGAFLADPPHPAGVVVGHHGQVAMAAFVGDLVDAVDMGFQPDLAGTEVQVPPAPA